MNPIFNRIKNVVATPVDSLTRLAGGDVRGALDVGVQGGTGITDLKQDIGFADQAYNDVVKGGSGGGAQAVNPGVGTGIAGSQDPHGAHGATTTDPNASKGFLGDSQDALSKIYDPKYNKDAPKGTVAGGDTTPGKGGTQSGPGILQNWFNQRASGTDPAWLYGTGRAEDAINKRYAASGGYNSSGANQSVSDMYANAVSQRQGQLDALAGGASGEHMGQLDQMFKYGTGLADAQSKTAGSYDTATANMQMQSEIARIQMMLNKGEIDQKTAQAQINQIMAMAGTTASAAGNYAGKGGGGTTGGGGNTGAGDDLIKPDWA